MCRCTCGDTSKPYMLVYLVQYMCMYTLGSRMCCVVLCRSTRESERRMGGEGRKVELGERTKDSIFAICTLRNRRAWPRYAILIFLSP